ncbi:hypothetical protein JAAARDRAFT_187826 [Jaapia argillacea MUCL 33604]|uniref:F-box domain-containing protein n=1 Tax=Jaapia argillacea MUCL 33604 TaxID=933084 RepID=A0A067QBR6_9AGAM|nr:hypothetical protein JAAARDRAFT_187826 [Jaapia argillacea MUCL 33604]
MNSGGDTPPSAILVVELLEHIFEQVPRSDLLSLCCASRLFNSIAIGTLYRTIELHTSSDVVKCCKTLLNVPGVANVVRHLVITIKERNHPPEPLHGFFPNVHLLDGLYFPPRRNDRTHLHSFYRLVCTALNSASGVTSLDLSGGGIQFETILGGCHFPRLRKLTYDIDLGPEAISFILRHPSIQNLTIRPSHTISPQTIPPMVLRELSSFTGPTELVPMFIPGSRVTEIGIVSSECSDDFDFLAEQMNMSSNPIRILRFTGLMWCLRLAEAVARSLSEIEVLVFTSTMLVERDHSRRPGSFLNQLQCILPSLNRLRRLDVTTTIAAYGLLPQVRDLDDEHLILEKWSDLCPTLTMCALPSDVLWTKGASKWTPDTSNHLGSLWVKSRLLQ